MGPRAGLDRCRKSRSYRDSIPGPSSPWPVAIPTELPGPLLFQYDLIFEGVFWTESMTKFSKIIVGFQNLSSFFHRTFLSDGNNQRFYILARRNRHFLNLNKSSRKEYSRHFTVV